MVNSEKDAKLFVAKHHQEYIVETDYPTTFIVDASDNYKALMGHEKVGIRVVQNDLLNELINE